MLQRAFWFMSFITGQIYEPWTGIFVEQSAKSIACLPIYHNAVANYYTQHDAKTPAQL